MHIGPGSKNSMSSESGNIKLLLPLRQRCVTYRKINRLGAGQLIIVCRYEKFSKLMNMLNFYLVLKSPKLYIPTHNRKNKGSRR